MAHYRKFVDTAFFDKWSPAMAYVLGFFAADGTMSVNSHGARYVSFSSTDRILLEHVRRLLRAEHQIRLKTCNRSKPIWKPIYQLQIGGGELFEQVRRLGFTPNKDKSLVFPRVPANCLSGFVRGYFDGDGCISFGWYQKLDRKGKSLYVQALFCSGSLGFLNSMDHAIRGAVGAAPGYLRRRDIGCYLYYQRRNDIRRIYHFMYPKNLPVEYYLPRKRTRFEEALVLLGAWRSWLAR